MSTALNFMPIPLVQSAKLAQLPRYLPKDVTAAEHSFDGVKSIFSFALLLSCSLTNTNNIINDVSNR